MTISSSRSLSIALIAARVLFGLIFLAAGLFKLAGAPMMVAEFGQLGLGQGFRYVTGAMEVLGAVMLVRPSSCRYGAVVLMIVSLGACVAQLSVLHQDIIHTLVFASVLAWIAYSYRSVRE